MDSREPIYQFARLAKRRATCNENYRTERTLAAHRVRGVKCNDVALHYAVVRSIPGERGRSLGVKAISSLARRVYS